MHLKIAMIDFRDKHVLCVAPHTDDEIACAGLLYEAKQQQASVIVMALSPCGLRELEGEFYSSCEAIGATGVLHFLEHRTFPENRQRVLDALRPAGKEPDVVLCPHSADVHQDHKTVRAECVRAFDTAQILSWEPITRPDPTAALRLNYYKNISQAAVDFKVALWGIYKSQHHRPKNSPALIRAQAEYRGAQLCPGMLAEAYEVVR